jgi:hypothetical protein
MGVAGCSLALLVLLLGLGLKGGGGNPDNRESEAQIGGSRSAGRAKLSWTDLEHFLGLLPLF